MGLSVVTVVEKNRNSFATDGINALRSVRNPNPFLTFERRLILKRRNLLFGLFYLLVIVILFCINHFWYAGHLSIIWTLSFALCLYLTWHFGKKRKKVSMLISICLAVVVIIGYIVSLPNYTYIEAVNILQNYYSKETFIATPNTKNQALAPKIENKEIKYYCYILEANGKHYYFDQYTGVFGEVTTDPKNR